MFFKVDYENSVKSSFKKQMARLFRDVINRKIDLYLSDLVMCEFIGFAPKNKELLKIYRQYLGEIYPDNSFVSCFFYLAAAINSCLIETGQAGDLKDTYSYILAVLAEIRYFVTRDKDLVRLYRFLSHLKKKDISEQRRQVNKIKSIYHSLCRAEEDAFPIDDVLGCILSGPSDLPVPISIEHLEDQIPAVLDKVETILWMFRTLNDIDQLMLPSLELPQEWNEQIVTQAKTRIRNIAHNVELQNLDDIDDPSFYIKLVEAEKKWEQETSDPELASTLKDQRDILWRCVYEEEQEYSTLQEEFDSEEPEIDFVIQCKSCGKQIEVLGYYEGVVDSDKRAMGAELFHKWSSDQFRCPSCNEIIEVIFWRYEYPLLCINYEDTECYNCKIISM